METGKTCTKCNTFKTLDNFYRCLSKKVTSYSKGLKSHCKECVSKDRKRYYQTEDGYKKKIEKAWKDKGIIFTLDEYNLILDKQNGGCAICKVKQNKNGHALCVDHDHNTGKVRGILCHDCNTSLGKFQDSVELLEKAIQYLEKNKGK